MRRRDRCNATLHVTGAPGSGSARVRVSGHIVLSHLAELEGWAEANFAGARVELAPGLTVYAADVCKLYRLGPAGWTEHPGPASTPELEPPRAPPPRAPSGPRRRPRPAPPPVAFSDALALLRALSGPR